MPSQVLNLSNRCWISRHRPQLKPLRDPPQTLLWDRHRSPTSQGRAHPQPSALTGLLPPQVLTIMTPLITLLKESYSDGIFQHGLIQQLGQDQPRGHVQRREGRRGRRRPRVNGRHSRFIALRGKSPHHIPSRLTLSPLRYDLDQAILPCESRMILYIYIYLFTGFIIYR